MNDNSAPVTGMRQRDGDEVGHEISYIRCLWSLYEVHVISLTTTNSLPQIRTHHCLDTVKYIMQLLK